MYRRPEGRDFIPQVPRRGFVWMRLVSRLRGDQRQITVNCPPLSGSETPELHRHRDVQQFVIGSRPITSGSNSRWNRIKQLS
jgi:hypothetical protein